MDCAAHPGTEARGPCAVCFKNVCDACAVYDIDGAPACERCGRQRRADNDALSSGLLGLVGVGYLATLAVGIVLFKARPFVGGLAAIVAIALGRAMQLLVKHQSVTPAGARTRATTAAAPARGGVDASSPPS